MSDPECKLWRLSPGFLLGVAAFEADEGEPLECALVTQGEPLRASIRWIAADGSNGPESNGSKLLTIALPGSPDGQRPKALEIRRQNGESVLGPVDLVTEELRKQDLRKCLRSLGPRARNEIVEFVCSTSGPRRSSIRNVALSKSLLAVREALRERPEKVSPAKGKLVAGCIEAITALAEDAFYIQGWVHDREAPITRLTAISPEGERIELLKDLFRFPRRDIDGTYRYFPDDAAAKPGFIAFFETQTISCLAGEWVVEIENQSGRIGEMVAPPVMQDVAQSARAILGTLPTQVLPDDHLMSAHVFPAMTRLQKHGRKLRNGVRVLEYGHRRRDPEISIIVPLYKRLDFLQHQLAQFALDPEVQDAELIFVLDSPDQDKELQDLATQLSEVYPVSFAIATLERSCGYAGANNIGVREAQGRLLVLLNSDVLPDKPGWLGKMAAFYDSKPDIGVMGPKLLFEDDSIQHAGIYFSLPNYAALAGTWANVIYFKGLDRDLPAANVARPVPAVTGACMMIEKSLYERLGGFPEVYVQGDHEDTDLCLQMIEAGRQNWYFPQAELYHLEGQSYPHPVRLRMALYNRWLQTRRWGPLIQAVMDKYPGGNRDEEPTGRPAAVTGGRSEAVTDDASEAVTGGPPAAVTGDASGAVTGDASGAVTGDGDASEAVTGDASEAVTGDAAGAPPADAPREAADASLVQVLEVQYSTVGSERLWGCHVDNPTPGSEIAANSMALSGWVLSKEHAAVSVEFTCDHGVLHTAQVDHPRPDVAAEYPQVAGSDRCGFNAVIGLTGLTPEFEVGITTVLRDGARVPIASVKARYGPMGVQAKKSIGAYQTFPEACGSSDSATKLQRLRLPDDLTGRSVLDLGCNEGFFCQEAWCRGASRVVGIDKNPEWIERARERDSQTDYRVLDWASLRGLDETFDLILLLSALHYADKPQTLLRDAMDLLNPDGVLVLECGVVSGSDAKWEKVERPVGDIVYHPTRAMISHTFRDAVVREMGRSVVQRGDPIERCVFHVTTLKPIVLLIAGEPKSGKTALMHKLAHGAHVGMSLDELLVSIPSWCRDEWLLGLWHSQPSKIPHRIDELIDFFSTHNAEGPFVEQILASNPAFAFDRKPGVTIIEGYALSRGSFAAWLAARLKERGYYVWHVEPAGSPAPAQSRLGHGRGSPRESQAKK